MTEAVTVMPRAEYRLYTKINLDLKAVVERVCRFVCFVLRPAVRIVRIVVENLWYSLDNVYTVISTTRASTGGGVVNPVKTLKPVPSLWLVRMYIEWCGCARDT